MTFEKIIKNTWVRTVGADVTLTVKKYPTQKPQGLLRFTLKGMRTLISLGFSIKVGDRCDLFFDDETNQIAISLNSIGLFKFVGFREKIIKILSIALCKETVSPLQFIIEKGPAEGYDLILKPYL